jgi:hypothetical protein
LTRVTTTSAEKEVSHSKYEHLGKCATKFSASDQNSPYINLRHRISRNAKCTPKKVCRTQNAHKFAPQKLASLKICTLTKFITYQR